MTHTLWQNISAEVVDQAIAQTFQLLIESDAEPSKAPASQDTEDFCMGVYCDAEQQSAVVVRCSRSLATMVTSRMLDASLDTLQEEDIVDATGELVNVVAGSLRGLMDRPGAMSTPFPITTDELTRMPGRDERHYLVEDHPLQLIRM